MRKRQLEKLLKKEIKEAASFDVTQIVGDTHKRPFPIRRVLAFALSFVLVVGALTFIPFIGRSKSVSDQGGVIVIDINPSIKLTYNKNGIITQADGINSDGKVLLSNLSVKGISYFDAVDKIFAESTNLGYFSSDKQNAVLISVTDSKNRVNNAMVDNLETQFNTCFTNKDFSYVVIRGDDTQSGEKGVSAQKAALIKKVVDLTQKDDKAADYYKYSISSLYELMTDCQRDSIKSELVQKINTVTADMQNQKDKSTLETFVSYITFSPQMLNMDLLQNVAGIIDKAHNDELKKCFNDFCFGWRAEHDPNALHVELSEKEKGRQHGQNCPPPDDQMKREFEQDWFGKQEEWRREIFG